MKKLVKFLIVSVALFALFMPGYSEPTPEQVKERTNLLIQAIESNNVEQAKACIKLGANVNTKVYHSYKPRKGYNNVKDCYTALTYAVCKNNKDITELLINAAANVNAKDDEGNTALMYAAYNGYTDIAELLINAGADVNAKILLKDRRVKFLDERENLVGNTVLLLAVINEKKDVVELLVKAGANVNAKDNGGNTALGIAAQNHKKDITEILINAGADVNAKDNDGRTALRASAYNGYTDIVELLINAGADVNAKGNDGWTALMGAAQYGNKEVTELLINAGADVNVTYDNGETLFIKMMSDRKYDIAKLLIKAGADVNAKNSNGETLLMQSIKNGDRSNVKFLIRMGADVNAADNEGITALTYAALYGQSDIAELLKTDRIDFMIDMVYVEGGTFQMGSTEYNSEKPVHQVTVSSFYIGKYEVTQAEYEEIMYSNPSNFKGDQRPVENVTWYDAVNYCNMLSEAERFTPCYTIDGTDVTCNWNANGYRLPTEAEWEYAARGGKHKSDFKYSGSDNIYEVAWYSSNSGSGTHEVGKKKANALGLYDMSGNVWEWCWDWYGNYSGNAVQNPVGAASGSYRVLRGGSWGDYASYCRCAYRYNYYFPFDRDYFLGFRVVRSSK